MFFFCVENCDLKLDFNKEDLRRSSRDEVNAEGCYGRGGAGFRQLGQR